MIYHDGRHPFRRDQSVPARVGRPWRGDLRRNAAGNAHSRLQSGCISSPPPPSPLTPPGALDARLSGWRRFAPFRQARRKNPRNAAVFFHGAPAHLPIREMNRADVMTRSHVPESFSDCTRRRGGSGSSRRVLFSAFDVMPPIAPIAGIPH